MSFLIHLDLLYKFRWISIKEHMLNESSLQTTLNNTISFSGISLHKGIVSNLQIKPAEEDTGIIFKRIDKFNNNIIKANLFTTDLIL